MSLSAIGDLDELAAFSPISADRPLTPVEEKTHSTALKALEGIDTSTSSALDPDRVLLSSTISAAIEVLNAGIEFEQWSTLQLKEMEESTNKIVDAIEQLLDLSRELSALDSENPKSNEKIVTLLKELKEKGVNLLTTDGSTLTKDQLLALKSTLGSHIEKSRTKIQQLFTKMQTVVQNMTSVNDTIKKILNDLSDLIRKILENGRRH